MKNKIYLNVIIWLLAFFLILPTRATAQQTDVGYDQQTHVYSQEELDRLLAPIALYPDTLLSQILMASTYPLEIVEADRWSKQNRGLSVDALDAALQNQTWDVSVKSLCHYPEVLSMMSERLDLTNDLGNAFLNQQDQVMDTVQSLRARADAQGNLKSTDNEKVISQNGEITIEPTTPDVIYQPYYDPCWVYGPWWYPSCEPLWFWYPGIVVGAGFFFGPAIFVGPIDFWCGFHWHKHQIFVNRDKTFFVHRPSITGMHGGVETWVHDPTHRRGIAYQSPATARRFGQTERPGLEARRAFRGFSTEGRLAGGGVGPALRPGMQRQTTQPSSTRPGSRPSTQSYRGNVFEGFGSSGRQVIQHSARGQQSMSGFGRSASSPSGGSGGFRSSGSTGGSGGSHSSGRSGGSGSSGRQRR